MKLKYSGKLDRDKLDKLISWAANSSMLFFEPEPDAEDKFSLHPVRGVFFMRCATSREQELLNSIGFVPQKEYFQPAALLPNEIGAISNIRIMLDKEFQDDQIHFDYLEYEK
jgi:hypothetical protein